MTMRSSMKSPFRSYALAFLALVTGACITTSSASAKGPWAPALDLEPSLRSAALVLAVRVEGVSQMRVVYGGKGTSTLYQYTFEPIRILKGVYSRTQLILTDADLRGYTSNFDPKDIQPGQQRLLLLGRSRVGYVGIHPGSSADLAFPQLNGRTDPLLSSVVAVLAHQELQDRQEIVTRLSQQLREATGRGAVVLLAALDRRSYIAAQQVPAFQALSHQLASEETIVRETAAHVLGNLLDADYLTNQTAREAAVAALVESLDHTDTSLTARVAAFEALRSGVDAVRTNEDAMHLITLDTPFDTLAELSARLDILGWLHENEGISAAGAVADLLDELPLDAPVDLQQSANQSWARIAAADAAERLFKRIRRKKALGLDGAAEVEAFGLVFPRIPDPWSLQRAIIEIGLTTAEQEAFIRACEQSPSPQLVSALTDMLDPRHLRLRRLAADLLMEIDTKAAAQALRPHLAGETNLAYKLRLAAFLGRHGLDDGYPYALEHMSDSRYLEVAVEAVVAIKKSGSAAQLLDIYKNSNDLGWKRAAVRALGLLGHTAFLDELRVLTRDLHHPLAPSAIQARADMGDATVIELLPDALSSRNEEVVVAAARAAAKLFPPQRGQGDPAEPAIWSALATLAQDPEAARDVRRHALEALVVTKDSRLDDVLIGMIRDTRIEQAGLLARVRELLSERKVRM